MEVFGKIKSNPDMQAPKGQKGVAALLNIMFKFGTTALSRVKFQGKLDAISAQESAGSSFSLKVPSVHFAQGMKLLADNELHPNMSREVLKAMQHRLVGIRTGVLKSADFLNTLHLIRALYPANYPGLRHTTIKSLKRLTRGDIEAYRQQVFRPDMTTIVVIGDVTPTQARKVVAANFGSWMASGAKPNTAYPAVPPNKPSQFNTPDASATQDTVTLVQTTPLTEGSPDRWALKLGNQILGGAGFNTQLTHDLRVKAGLVYSVQSHVNLQKHGGTFTVTYGSDPDKVAAARAMVIRDVKRMQNAPLSATRLHDAKGKVLRLLAISQSSFSTIAAILLNDSLRNRPLDNLDIAAHKYVDVTAGEIQTAFKKYVRPSAFVTSVKGPAPKG